MEDRATEDMLRELMQQDFSGGTDEFREALLERCLSVLGTESQGAALDDDELDLLAAAGSPGSLETMPENLRRHFEGVDS